MAMGLSGSDPVSTQRSNHHIPRTRSGDQQDPETNSPSSTTSRESSGAKTKDPETSRSSGEADYKEAPTPMRK